jgi:hypothetical protein
MTRDSATGTLQLYVDGTLAGMVTGDVGVKSTPFFSIGRLTNGGFFRGIIDDFRVYNRVLGAAEVTQLYGGDGG